LTYTINVANRGLTTEAPPVLTDVIPMSTTFMWADGGGMTQTVSETTFVRWTLPELSPGESVQRRFTVLVDSGLVSGTQIINSEYDVFGYGNVLTDAVTGGPPVTTTVRELGLIDSYKTVTPLLSLPGPDTVLTFYLHIVNSGPVPLSGVHVYDVLPWEHTTYQRDALTSSGTVISDIISFDWTGDVGPFAEEVVTATVVVDPGYQGVVTNTATISHPLLADPVIVDAVAYIAAQPVLAISKMASPDPVPVDGTLRYTIKLVNTGQEATSVVITDTLPGNVTYVPDSASDSGGFAGGQVRWSLPRLGAMSQKTLQFDVLVDGAGDRVRNAAYGVRTAEGVVALGQPVITPIEGGQFLGVYLPLVMRATP
jgi:uncharacterized repeat protein (TIGR01451 family)